MNTDQRRICDISGLPKPIIDAHGITPSLVCFDAQSILFKPGDRCKAFLILCSGSIRVEITAKSGRDVTLYRIKSSESCILTTSALLNTDLYYAQGLAESNISAIALSVEDFHKAIQFSGAFAKYVLAGYASRLSSIVGLVDRMAARDVMLDVSQYLVVNINQNMLISATQTQIANEIGTAREVVGRKLQSLELDGVLERRRGEVFVKDLGRLKEIARM